MPISEPDAHLTTSEAQALAAIVSWSVECPTWQRDALRRLCEADKLYADDIDALLTICKSASNGEPLTADHVRDPAAGSAAVTLKRLHSIQHVNALVANERLTFDKIGVTVIYGDNGSGKSGYARVLKKICRARSKDESIHPNIYDVNPGVPTASIDFAINGQNKSAAWTLGQPSDPVLSAVSVFDSRTANVHVDQTNDVAYTPLPLKILAALAQASQEIKNRLTAEITAIQKQTPEAIRKPACQAGTGVGKLIAGLSGATQPDTVETLAALTDADRAHLDKLNGDLAADPARIARQLLALKAKGDGFITRLDALAKAVSDETAQAIRTKSQVYETARVAAQAASVVLFADEPLPNVGSDVWRSLWEAARTYSQRDAYPDKSFPVTDDLAVCVLCQQEITPAAAGRLNQFEVFVKDESKRREEGAKATYAAALDSFRAARGSLPELMTMVASIRDELEDDNLAQAVRRAAVSCLWRHRQIERHHAMQSEAFYPAAATLPLDALRARSAGLATRAAGLTAEAGSEARKKLIAERDELADLKWLGTVKADVLAEIGRRKQITALQTAIKDTATNRITTTSTEVAEILVTNALRAQFAKEVARIGVAALAIELKQEKSAYGIPRFKVALTRKPDANVGEVLSEGEHRCVALAAFLAELATIDTKSAIVFDDPVSSLDHMHREAVANRLADEGQQRQVIVFTHDIAFLFLLDEACRDPDRNTHFAIRSISKGQDHAGFCNTNPPLKAQPLHTVIESMQTRLNNERILFDRGNQDGWEQTVRSLQEQLRTTWERAVEEALSPVLKRLSNKVTTLGLAKITVITIQDCETMRAAFGRCSELLHSEAAGLNKPLPAPDKIEAEITTMRDWIASIEQRQKATKPV